MQRDYQPLQLEDPDTEALLSSSERGHAYWNRYISTSVWVTPTVLLSIIAIVVLVAYLLIMWISVPHEDVLESDKITAYHLRLVASVIVFIILGIINRVMHAYHYVKKFGGGMSFAVRIAPIVEVPWLMSALGIAMMLLLQVWPEDELGNDVRFTAVRAISTVVFVFALPCFLYYIYALKQALLAGFVHEPIPMSLQPSLQLDDSSAADINTDGESKDDIIAKQADMIRYLKEQRKNMSKQILELNEKLSRTREQEDQSSNLIVKDQEIKQLKAELEASRARAEQSSAADRLQGALNQLEQENRKLKSEVSQLQNQVDRLKLQLEVEKEASAEMQKLNEKLNTELAQLRAQRK